VGSSSAYPPFIVDEGSQQLSMISVEQPFEDAPIIPPRSPLQSLANWDLRRRASETRVPGIIPTPISPNREQKHHGGSGNIWSKQLVEIFIGGSISMSHLGIMCKMTHNYIRISWPCASRSGKGRNLKEYPDPIWGTLENKSIRKWLSPFDK